MNKIIFSILVLLVIVLLFGLMLYQALTLPIVYESYSLGTCVEVFDPSGQYSCDNLPAKYHHEWRS